MSLGTVSLFGPHEAPSRHTSCTEGHLSICTNEPRESKRKSYPIWRMWFGVEKRLRRDNASEFINPSSQHQRDPVVPLTVLLVLWYHVPSQLMQGWSKYRTPQGIPVGIQTKTSKQTNFFSGTLGGGVFSRDTEGKKPWTSLQFPWKLYLISAS